jgi:NAD(P)-dependent dehydrogenase (short-subunit alcohol dehydrogenase family)
MLHLEPGAGLIAGGASGIGAAVCELLQREGCLHGPNQPRSGT